MEFDKVTAKHINQGIKDFQEKGFPSGFGPSSTYDISFEGKLYPPKAIMAYANYHAIGRKIERYFKGGMGTDCFKTYERCGFEIREKAKKNPYNWTQTHKELVEYLRDKRNDIPRLLELLENAGVFVGTDQEEKGVKSRIKELDPFTFFCYIYKYGEKKRLEILQHIANELELTYPEGERGIPSSNAQKVWMFPYTYERVGNEMDILWELFEAALDNKITNHLFQQALDIRNVGKTKITEVLFYIRPDKYFPINGPSKPFLNDHLGIGPTFNTYDQYVNILKQIRGKTETPFPQLSFEAWQYSDSLSNKVNESKNSYDRATAHYCVGFNWNTNESQLDRFLKNGIWENGFDDKYIDKVKAVPEGALLAAKTAFTRGDGGSVSVLKIYAIGEVLENPGDGKTLKVEWFNDFEPFELLGRGAYMSTISRVNHEENIHYIFYNGYENTDLTEASTNQIIQTSEMMIPLNQIFYGPPGTGKTYKLQREFFPKFTVSEDQLTREQFLKNEIEQLSWWQVITLVLLDQNELKVRDIYEHEYIQIKEQVSSSKTVMPTIWGQLQAHTVDDCENVNVAKRSNPQYFYKDEDALWSIVEDLVEQLYPEATDLLDRLNSFEPVEKEIKNYEMVTFHQSFTYEDFVEGIKPKMNEEEIGELQYEIRDGVFKRLCNKAKNDKDQSYAIFIDEINRGNVASIFGELITLIEPDKRHGEENKLSVTLPYSKEKFTVPDNLYIIGTMNTADRSVEALDSALRRRFEFEEVMPEYNLLRPSEMYWDLLWRYEDVDWSDDDYKTIEDEFFKFYSVSNDFVLKRKDLWETFRKQGRLKSQINKLEELNRVNFRLDQILKTINKRITALLDRDHQIGHSYFLKLKDSTNLENDLRTVFTRKIIPLLQEYFFNDYVKIAMVIGEGFLEKVKSKNNLFAHADESYASDYDQVVRYEIKQPANIDIKEAIEILMNIGNGKQQP